MSDQRTGLLILIFCMMIAAAVTGTLVYMGAKTQEQPAPIVMDDKTDELMAEQQKTKEQAEQLAALNSELLATKVRLSVKESHDQTPLQHPTQKNTFYYVTYDGSAGTIWEYDVARDSEYLEKGTVNLTLGRKEILVDKTLKRVGTITESDEEIRLRSIVGDELVYAVTSIEFMGGQCGTLLLPYDKMLFSVSLSTPGTKQPYTIPTSTAAQEQAEMDACAKAMVE
ncbi:MAG TPA: hypothetical protein VEA18_02730 [Candidatus Kapabacteria bacterium]|nr:hypothetical protein [Candidatus Kapabacteria bacterium]